ncbi:hypothetical protein JYK02_05070 [Corallococcus macrosporus]|uniref:Uncharacterized protein n=1 Tax=Corallococcus macrosporus TaxID=35 RepID=A0ABS3D5D0_9BACT|nr:hypothetical protein [Corallococcus macrosporus]MBN8226879.1 hypothetical protein [Corallococcus macrosporus]
MAQKWIRLVEDEFLAFICENKTLDASAFEQKLEQYDVLKRLGPDEEIRSLSTSDLKNAGYEFLAERDEPDDWHEVIIKTADAEKFPMKKEVRLRSGPLLRVKADKHSREGHYGATHQALQRVTRLLDPNGEEFKKALIVPRGTFPSYVHELMADASQDGDFYAWELPEAHAQAGCDEEGTARNTPCAEPGQPNCWQQRFFGWVGKQLARAKAACDAGDVNAFYYWIGYSLHPIQDLAPHKGRTNCEHAFNAYVEKDSPDNRPVNFDLAVSTTEAYLKVVGDEIKSASCLSSVRTMRQDLPVQNRTWKRQNVGAGWNPTWALGLLKYRFTLASKYKKLKPPESTVRWFTNGDEKDQTGPAWHSCSEIQACQALLNELKPVVKAAFSAPSRTSNGAAQ